MIRPLMSTDYVLPVVGANDLDKAVADVEEGRRIGLVCTLEAWEGIKRGWRLHLNLDAEKVFNDRDIPIFLANTGRNLRKCLREVLTAQPEMQLIRVVVPGQEFK